MEFSYFLDSRLRGNDKKGPSPGLLCRPAFPRRGEAICFIRLKCYKKSFGKIARGAV